MAYARAKPRCSDNDRSSRKKTASERPTRPYWMGWTLVRRSTSDRKNAAKVNPMNRKAYLVARSLIR
jgi:hypothetical protein